MTSSELVNSYLEKYPDTPNRTLARMIYAKAPQGFRDIDAVRNLIRYRRGVSGKENKQNAAKNYGKYFQSSSELRE